MGWGIQSDVPVQRLIIYRACPFRWKNNKNPERYFRFHETQLMARAKNMAGKMLSLQRGNHDFREFGALFCQQILHTSVIYTYLHPLRVGLLCNNFIVCNKHDGTPSCKIDGM